METFTKARDFIDDPGFAQARRRAVSALDLNAIDPPITDIIDAFSTIPHCFTLQSCYGHFVCSVGQDPLNLEPIPPDQADPVKYRIAYLALCLENSPRGHALRELLTGLTAIDPGYVKFGSAGWFWERRVNTFALQIMPGDHAGKDEALLEVAAARHVAQVRDRFFEGIRALLSLG